jgi:uncharacterized Zn finger protein
MATGRLAALLDWDAIVDLAGSLYLQRGMRYLEDGRVGPIRATDDAIEATVHGEHAYAVRISLDGSRIASDCTCPIGETGAFCKHCAALSLAWLRPPAADPDAAPRAKTRRRVASGAPVDPVEPFLAGLARDALIELITSEMDRVEELAARVRLRAAMAAPAGEGLPALEQALDRATHIRGILRYGDVAAFARGVDDTADMLDRLVRDGRPGVAIDLAERALHRLEQALEQADDSDGLIGDLLDRFQTLHLDACRAARPDPVKLAERLFRWELDGEWDVFRGAAQRYADVLGEVGLAAYRRLAEVEWARIPALGPGAEDTADEDGDRFNVTYMMESLAQASHDVDMEIAVLSRDLSSAYGFLQIAQLCRDADRGDEALDWAERGVRAFPSRTDVRIREFLADEYLRRSRGDQAMALIWAEFSEEPGLERYKLLKQYADRIGSWAAWRLRALDELGRSIEQAMAAEPAPARPPRFRWQQPPDGSRLVDILLWEGNLDAAWHEARRLGCSGSIWLQLALRSEETHPEQALAVYRQEVEALLQVTDKRVYAQAVDLLRRIGALMARLGRKAEFDTYAAEVRVANARRPAFLALFDAARLVERPPALRVVQGARSS